jgi:hypothetical protein
LNNSAVSGLLVQVKWQDLQPLEPGAQTPSAPSNSDSTAFSYLDAAFNAVDMWNKHNPSAAPKTLQLSVSPGFNSPAWLFNHLQSCDGHDPGAVGWRAEWLRIPPTFRRRTAITVSFRCPSIQ